MWKLSLSLVLVPAVAAAAPNPETLAERSQARARAVLDRAVQAIGGAEALGKIVSFKLVLEGEQTPRLQMPTPEPPFGSSRFREVLVLDLEKNRLFLEQKTAGFGFEGHNVIVLEGGAGNIHDLRARTTTPVPPAQGSQQQFVQYYRRLPHLILRQALDRATSLRHLGEDRFENRKHDVITFAMADAQQIALYVDSKTGLVSKYELVFTDPLTGEEASEIMFGDYAAAGALKVPRTWTFRQAGDILSRYQVQAEFNPAITDATFKVAEADLRKISAPPLTLEPEVEKLAEGVFVIHNVAGQNQNTMAIAFKDFVVAVEAPGSSAGAEKVLEKIKEAIPGKPVRYLAMTHHHGDHIGGLRPFIAEGATIVTTAGNRKVVETMAAAPQNDRLAKRPRKPELLFLEGGKRTITDGQRTLELIDIGPHPHAREMVVAYLPGERVVFQGDLFFMPRDSVPFGPPQESTLSFAKKLNDLGLAVDKIASVHGRTATIAEFKRALAEPSKS
jgi:glyoxylase-like metal-dependent hydrolase (beta-lactamase superfamily II)